MYKYTNSSNMYTYFEAICIHAKKAEGTVKEELEKVLVEDSLDDFIDTCVEHNLINKEDGTFLKKDTYTYEHSNETGEYLNYYEVDEDKRTKFVNAILGWHINNYMLYYSCKQDNKR